MTWKELVEKKDKNDTEKHLIEAIKLLINTVDYIDKDPVELYDMIEDSVYKEEFG
jgi:hypothetical protein